MVFLDVHRCGLVPKYLGLKYFLRLGPSGPSLCTSGGEKQLRHYVLEFKPAPIMTFYQSLKDATELVVID